MFWKFVSLSLYLAFGASHLFAAEIEITKFDNSNFDSLITIVGDLSTGDSFQFQAVANSAKSNSIVVMSSRGGKLIEGINIGRKIKEMGFATSVHDTCASACALAWLAGAKKYMTEDAKVGFHVAYVEGGRLKESGQGNAIVGLYLGELGYRQNVVEYVTNAPPEGMQWLSLRDAKLLGIGASVFASRKTKQKEGASARKPEERAVLFVLEGIREHTKSTGDAVDWITSNYHARVVYYKESKSLNEVMRDKSRYFKRWPIRKTNVDENSIGVTCEKDLCFVSGTYFWNVESPERNKNASGLATFLYAVLMTTNMQIVGESGEVVSKN